MRSSPGPQHQLAVPPKIQPKSTQELEENMGWAGASVIEDSAEGEERDDDEDKRDDEIV